MTQCSYDFSFLKRKWKSGFLRAISWFKDTSHSELTEVLSKVAQTGWLNYLTVQEAGGPRPKRGWAGVQGGLSWAPLGCPGMSSLVSLCLRVLFSPPPSYWGLNPAAPFH